jgi:hypothetical protein
VPAAKSVPVKLERLPSKPEIETHPVDVIATPLTDLTDLTADLAAGLQVGGDTDLHEMKRHPLVTVMLGFVTGVFIGRVLARRSSSTSTPAATGGKPII